MTKDSKRCPKCGETKTFAEFYLRKNGQPGAYCRSCYAVYAKERYANPEKREHHNAVAREWAKANRPRINEKRNARRRVIRTEPERAERIRQKERERHPDKWIRAQYGMTRAQWNALLESQGGKCAICGTTEGRGNGKTNHFHIDHDHGCCPGKKSCGKCIRGLLCNQCNPMLGYAQDDPKILRAAAAYLDRWKEVMKT